MTTIISLCWVFLVCSGPSLSVEFPCLTLQIHDVHCYNTQHVGSVQAFKKFWFAPENHSKWQIWSTSFFLSQQLRNPRFQGTKAWVPHSHSTLPTQARELKFRFSNTSQYLFTSTSWPPLPLEKLWLKSCGGVLEGRFSTKSPCPQRICCKDKTFSPKNIAGSMCLWGN